MAPHLSRDSPNKQDIARLGAAALGVLLFAGTSLSAENAQETGQAIYKRANCVGCHKWHGDGGGGYGGAALSLRKTELDKDQIIQTVTCGRPGTGMPFFSRDPYPKTDADPPNCYGLSKKDLADLAIAQGGVLLREEEIAAVAGYVITNIKGKGEPNLADCIAFFGDQSNACEVYKVGGHHALPTPATTQ